MSRRTKNITKRIKRMWRAKKPVAIIAVVALLACAGLLIERNAMSADYTELLNTIAQGESKGNYNAYFGNANNTTLKFTEMSVGDIMRWQQEFVAKGNASSAVGKYQFISTTLEGLLNELNIDRDTRFDEALQDRLAVRLLERRGVQEYLRGHLSREQLAHNLSKEWAALPRVTGTQPAESYYAGDGLNHARISVDQVLAAIDSLHEKTS